MKSMRLTAALLVVGSLSAFAGADVRVMNFDTDASGAPIASGATLNSQYAAWGVSVTPNCLTGASGSLLGDNLWATNTNMSITSSDVGVNTRAGGGNLLHSFNGWFQEDGDPVFALDFATPIDEISVVFTGIGAGNTFAGIRAWNMATNTPGLSVNVADPGANGALYTQTLTLSGLAGATRIVVVPGTFEDWVGVDDIRFVQAVPTPGSAALACVGGLLAARRRRK